MVVAVWPLAACSAGYWLESESSNRQTPSCHRERHSPDRAAGPTGSGRDPGRIRASPVVHADETGWRQNGNNGYVWTFSTPTERYFLRRGRGKAVVDEALGESFSGVLVSDSYAACHHYDGPKQQRWAHLLWDIHDQRTLYPKDDPLARWPAGRWQSTNSMSRPKPAAILRLSDGVSLNWPCNGNCRPSAASFWLTRRLSRPGCAGALSARSRACPVLDTGNSPSSWPNRTCQRTTTQPSAAGAI